MEKEKMDQIKNFLFNKTGNWSLCAFASNEDLIEKMQEEYPEVLQKITQLNDDCVREV